MSIDAFKEILINESICPGIFFENVRDSGIDFSLIKKEIKKCKTKEDTVKLINEYC